MTTLTARQRVAVAAVMLAIVVAFTVLGSLHHGSSGGDPCASGNAPQVCEAQQHIDKQHEAANVAGASANR